MLPPSLLTTPPRATRCDAVSLTTREMRSPNKQAHKLFLPDKWFIHSSPHKRDMNEAADRSGQNESRARPSQFTRISVLPTFTFRLSTHPSTSSTHV